MRIFYYILKKEFLIIQRDYYSLAVLFIMPVVFILIMSLAMRDLFQLHSKVRMDVMVVNRDSGEQSRKFLELIGETGTFSLIFSDKDTSVDRITREMYRNDYKFSFIIGENFSSFIGTQKGESTPLILLVNPTVNSQFYEIVRNIGINVLGKLKSDSLLSRFGELLEYQGIDKTLIAQPPASLMETRYVYKDAQQLTVPTSVQQSVPAWLVLSMYFIVIPISNTFISERNHGTIIRFRSMNLPKGYLLFSKILPYFLVNQVQFGLMILVGVFVVPLLGGDALTPGNSYPGLLLISAGVSFSAVCLALFIASVSKTTEQAATTGGVLNLVLGAVGGVMVPKFVMPGFMQEMAKLSPLSWGLDGFLDIFLRNGNAADVVYETSVLTAFGAVMLILTLFVMKRRC